MGGHDACRALELRQGSHCVSDTSLSSPSAEGPSISPAKASPSHTRMSASDTTSRTDEGVVPNS